MINVFLILVIASVFSTPTFNNNVITIDEGLKYNVKKVDPAILIVGQENYLGDGIYAIVGNEGRDILELSYIIDDVTYVYRNGKTEKYYDEEDEKFVCSNKTYESLSGASAGGGDISSSQLLGSAKVNPSDAGCFFGKRYGYLQPIVDYTYSAQFGNNLTLIINNLNSIYTVVINQIWITFGVQIVVKTPIIITDKNNNTYGWNDITKDIFGTIQEFVQTKVPYSSTLATILHTARKPFSGVVGLSNMWTTCTYLGYGYCIYTTNPNKERQVIYHELGHIFGSGHDGEASLCSWCPECQFCQCTGKYVMNPYSLSAINPPFSYCSQYRICTALSYNAYDPRCLIPIVDGDGICNIGDIDDCRPPVVVKYYNIILNITDNFGNIITNFTVFIGDQPSNLTLKEGVYYNVSIYKKYFENVTLGMVNLTSGDVTLSYTYYSYRIRTDVINSEGVQTKLSGINAVVNFTSSLFIYTEPDVIFYTLRGNETYDSTLLDGINYRDKNCVRTPALGSGPYNNTMSYAYSYTTLATPLFISSGVTGNFTNNLSNQWIVGTSAKFTTCVRSGTFVAKLKVGDITYNLNFTLGVGKNQTYKFVI